MELAQARQQKRRRLDEGHGNDLDPNALEILYINFLAAHHEALTLVECSWFRAFLTFLNSSTDVWLPRSHQSIRLWLLRQYDHQKVPVRLILKEARSQIHIGADLWRGDNLKEYLAVTAEGVNKQGNAFHFLLGLKQLTGSKAGEEQAPLVMQVVKDFDIQHKLGYFVMDNDGTNDTMLRCFSYSNLHS